MRILVLGGYGLIGSAVVRRLASAGHAVAGLGRNVEAARRRHPEAEWLQADIARLATPEDWAPLIAGFDAVVNCAGALQDGLRDDLRAVQDAAMRALFTACERGRLRRVVQISASGASADARTAFMRTKGAADAALAASALDWIILRPGLVLAPESHGGTALLRGLASVPLVTPLTAGDGAIQTVHVDDVAEAVLAAVEGRVPAQSVLDLVEDGAHSLAATVRAFRAWLGHPPAPVLPVPSSLGRLAFRVGDALGRLGWRPPLRTTALLQIEAGVRGDPAPWRALTGRSLLSLPESLARLPSTVQERWYGRLVLLKPLLLGTLALFWLVSGLVGLARLDAAAGVLTERGTGAGFARFLVVAGGLLDLALGAAILVRVTAKAACLGMVATTLAYLLAGTVTAPDLWLDPLGAYVKTVPSLVLALVALAILDER